MDIEVSILTSSSDQNTYDWIFNFATPITFQPTCADNIEVPNHTLPLEYEVSTKLSPPDIIPYSANILADPNLWDSGFVAIFLFGTNKF